MRKIIFDSVGKKFDGDYDILFMNLKNNQIFWDKLSAKANDAGLTNADFNVIISQIPKLQISLPVNYNIWDVTSFVPKVAFRPYDKDDRDIDSVKAYDQAGTLYLLDAKTKPSEPVLVVGINERTNYDGIIIYASSCDGCGYIAPL